MVGGQRGSVNGASTACIGSAREALSVRKPAADRWCQIGAGHWHSGDGRSMLMGWLTMPRIVILEREQPGLVKGVHMLSNASVTTMLPVKDMARARRSTNVASG
ncbi:hypothetical protein Y695_01808 [Hydrogenophaga sp. T4]|nr:hypothetical protein Y695_01808 [Hydrogenophaga sp. T4]